MAASEERPTEMVLRWLAAEGDEYVGQWVALAGGKVVAAGWDREMVAEAGRLTGRRVVLVEVGGQGAGYGARRVWE